MPTPQAVKTKIAINTAFFLLLFQACLNSVFAQELDIKLLERSLESIEFQTFSAGFKGEDSLLESINRTNVLRDQLNACIAEKEAQLTSLTRAVGEDAVTELLANESPAAEEAEIKSNIQKFRAEITQCRVLLEKSSQVLDKLIHAQTAAKQDRLGIRIPSLVDNVREGTGSLNHYLKQVLLSRVQLSKQVFTVSDWLPELLILIFSVLAGWLLKRNIAYIAPPEISVNQGGVITPYVLETGRRMLPLLSPVVLLGLFLYFARDNLYVRSPLLQTLSILVVGFVFVRALVSARRQGYFLAPVGAEPEQNRRKLSPRLILLTVFLVAWIILEKLGAPTVQFNSSHALIKNFLVSGIILSGLEIIWHAGSWIKHSAPIFLIRLIASLFLWMALFANWIGYQNLGDFIWQGVLITAGAYFVFWLSDRVSREFYDGMDQGQNAWQKRFRDKLSVEENTPVPGLVWLRMLTALLLWVGLIIVLLKAWGVPNTQLHTLYNYVSDGFSVGDNHLVPGHIVLGIAVFSLLLMVVTRLKEGLNNRYLSRARMNSGARDALTTITGYVGFVIAAIIGLSIAGVKLSNLALVAGALSVGIGFGLQNVVNNFVSGIILLFERPIKTGDWIVTPSAEGYVRKISVRSTEVETFDRSEVIVPNSELISNAVTNWTLHNKNGRIIVPVGVAYGSDTALVREVLMDIPLHLKEVIKNNPRLPITVYFLRFGDSTLDFELRCFIYDISESLRVKSELHFMIDAGFRKHNIEIAFPQRVVHLRQEGESESG